MGFQQGGRKMIMFEAVLEFFGDDLVFVAVAYECIVLERFLFHDKAVYPFAKI